jgi:hypothetical protein
VSAPTGTSGTITVPATGNAVIRVSGKLVPGMRACNTVSLPVNGGDYLVQVVNG